MSYRYTCVAQSNLQLKLQVNKGVYVYVCILVCMHICMYVYIYHVCICTCAIICTCMYTCIVYFVEMYSYVCLFDIQGLQMLQHKRSLYIRVDIFLYMHFYVCIYMILALRIKCEYVHWMNAKMKTILTLASRRVSGQRNSARPCWG